MFPSLNTPSGQNNKQVTTTLRTSCWTTLATGNMPLQSALELNLACRDTVLYYSIRPKAGPGIALKGDGIEDGIPVQPQDESLLGQIDGLEAGVVSGWACSRGQLLKPLEVSF